MIPNAFQDETKMHKKIMQKFIDFLIEFLMNFGGFGRVENYRNFLRPAPRTLNAPRMTRIYENPFFWVSLAEIFIFSRHLALLVNPKFGARLVPYWI